MSERTLTFLIGINDGINQNHYSKIAGILEYKVILRYSATELIRAIKELQPDKILMDLDLGQPRVDDINPALLVNGCLLLRDRDYRPSFLGISPYIEKVKAAEREGMPACDTGAFNLTYFLVDM